jgi:LmbE family N-acetylglucosaminyl deacetylase
MALEQEQRAALRILEGIEEGAMSATDLFALVEDADPALLYLIFTWMLKRYADHVNADAVVGRLVELSSRGSIAKKMKEGQADPVVQWFEESYSYRQLEANEFIELIGIHLLLSQKIHEHSRIKISGARSHYHPSSWRKRHRSINAFAISHRRQAATISQMREDHATAGYSWLSDPPQLFQQICE